MVNFDLRLLIIVVAILASVLGLHLFNLKHSASSKKSPIYWAVGSFSTSASLLAVSVFPWPFEILNLILFNLLVIGGQCFYLQGIWEFKEKKTNYILIILLPLISIVQVLYFTVIQNEPGIRMAINSLLYAIWAFYAFFEMLFPPEKAFKFVFRTNSFLFFTYGLLMLLRAFLSYQQSSIDFLSATPINLTLFILVTGIQVVLAYGFIIMLHTRLAEDLRKQLSMRQKLLSIIGHDLKGSINVIGGFSELLNKNIEKLEIEKSKQFAGYIKQSAIQMNALLTNLLDWAKIQGKIENFYPEKLDINELIDDEISLNSSVANNKQINVEFKDSQPIIISGDRNMLKTILRNLLINAIKFTNPGGTIKVSSRIIENYVEITVSDSGIGIEPHILKKLFKTDEQISTEGTAKETGSGLGLLLCKEFVNKHHGEIFVESQVEKGSVFRFTLPFNQL